MRKAPNQLDSDQQPAYRTVKETARHLRLCEKHVRRLISRGELHAYRFGSALRIKKQDIDAYAEANRVVLSYDMT